MNPFYQSEECFRRYETAISTALGNYPNPVRFKSPTRVPSTDAARCTNALRAYKNNRWPTSNPIFSEFDAKPLRCWNDRTHAIIGAEPSTEIELMSLEAGRQHAMMVKNPSEEDIALLVDLLDRGVITMPLEFSTSYSDAVMAAIEGRWNVAPRREATSIIVF